MRTEYTGDMSRCRYDEHGEAFYLFGGRICAGDFPPFSLYGVGVIMMMGSLPRSDAEMQHSTFMAQAVITLASFGWSCFGRREQVGLYPCRRRG
ncbi:hypothetical protein QBC34DRAFT_396750 [Podospora aff. communis PSN243]|uniref:Uncharacterized protein n=1 Tax=Podospora aff. communis PSN243 TaxID=3040156 RepID=A0AAV9GZ96_9PEZI|nr:hypothetical protein QBC34DRAFT_396750 [Podospora aff. communis PSN243]